MKVYIHCAPPSESAMLLAQTLRGLGVPTTRSRNDDWLLSKMKKGDVVIGWGDAIPFKEGVRIFNSIPERTKLQELEELAQGGVPVPPFDTTDWGKGWLGRSLHHQEGSDFLPPGQRPRPAFWTRKLDITEEYRFHIFHLPDGFKSLRVGKKVPREGFENPHKWVRSYQHGWRLSYGKFEGLKKQREAAKKAIEVLGMDFGAVDTGVLKGSGEAVVLEVNSRVGFDAGGSTVQKYAEALKSVVENGQNT